MKLGIPLCGVETGIAGNHIRHAAEALPVPPPPIEACQPKSIVDVLLLSSASRLLGLNLAQQDEGAADPGGCKG